MQIQIPLSWLKDHLDTTASAEKIQELLSLSGPSVEKIHYKDGEPVFDIEVTTNRVDSMSVRGIAREAAVILESAGVSATLKPLTLPALSDLSVETSKPLPLPKIFPSPSLCSRILCVVLAELERAATPAWMARNLGQVDISIHDAAIDITNYITHDLGYPCHAFDYDKIMELGGEIHIKLAEPGQKFQTLDGEWYTCMGGEVVFTNQDNLIIDLPGIKGTANSAISAETKNILFWIESVDPKRIRFGSMTHAIRTVAAQLNEKDVDPELATDVLSRGIELYQKICSAQIASPIYDDYSKRKRISPISVEKSLIDTYLGIDLPTEQIVKILESLGCSVEEIPFRLAHHNRQTERDDKSDLKSVSDLSTSAQKGTLTLLITPPTYRKDLTIPVDFVEEIARIYGYYRLPSTLMATPIPTSYPDDIDLRLESKLKHFLRNIGWQEIYSYSMVSEQLALESGKKTTDHVRIANPLTDDRVYLRTSLIPSLKEAIELNPTEKVLSVFEIANVYWKNQLDGELPTEKMILGMVSNRELRQVKGDLEVLFDHLHIVPVHQELNDPKTELITQSSIITTDCNGGEVQLGSLAILSNGYIAIQLEIAALVATYRTYPEYHPVAQTAQISEDLTFTIVSEHIGKVIKSIKEVSPLIQSVTLKDQYKHNYTFSLMYHDPVRNLSSKDIEPVRKSVVDSLQRNFRSKLVGKV